MKTYKIYTAGAMSGRTFAEQMNWRMRIDHEIRNKTDAPIQFIHPPMYYEYGAHLEKCDDEVKQWETAQIRDSDIVIVNLEGANDSVGTHYELATADAVNAFGNRHIYIIGLGNSDVEHVHPWIRLSLHREEENYAKAAEYIVNYLLL